MESGKGEERGEEDDVAAAAALQKKKLQRHHIHPAPCVKRWSSAPLACDLELHSGPVQHHQLLMAVTMNLASASGIVCAERCSCIQSKHWGDGKFKLGGGLLRGRKGKEKKEGKRQKKQGMVVVEGNLIAEVVTQLPWMDRVQELYNSQEWAGAMAASASAVSAFAQLSEGERVGIVGVGAFGWVYLTARPGVLRGALDSYVWAPLQFVIDGARGRRSWRRKDFLVGERLGEGSFGTVYTGALLPRSNGDVEEELGRRGRRMEEFADYQKFQKVILKKVKVGVLGAEECGEMEEWFNYRMCRAAPDVCAKYMGSFRADTTRGQFTEGGKWLVWNAGDSTLLDFMKQRSFPQNLEVPLFGRTLNMSDPVQRSSLIVKKIMRQVIRALDKMHAIGIIHRDVKPSNVVVTNEGKLKFIDFGAATDLRVGKNYIPDRGMLDPDYCPPELYVLPEATPKPPPAPVAAMLSPFIWQFNSPDLFDMYSAGVMFLQMASAGLRTPIGIQTFKKEIADVDYDLRRWREVTKVRANFDVLDLDKGKGWDLATKLICQRGLLRRGRLSARAALRHPYFLLGGDQASTMLSKVTFAK